MYGSGITTLVISNDDLNDLIQIIPALEEHDMLIKGTSKTIKNETKEQNGGFLSMLLGTLGASLLGDLLTGKRTEQNRIECTELVKEFTEQSRIKKN